MREYSREDIGTTEGFTLEVNSLESLKVLSCSLSLKLTTTWGIDIPFEKLTPEIEG